MKFLKIGLACLLCFSVFLCASLMFSCGNKTTVKFNTRGGNDIDEELITRGSTFGEDNVILPTPTRLGYTFEGWFFDKDCTSGNEFYANSQVNGSTTIYAKWSQNPRVGTNLVTITLKDFYGPDLDYSFTVQRGSSIVLPTPPVRDDKVFNGFFYDEDCQHVCPNDQIAREFTAYTGWSDKDNNLPEPQPIDEPTDPTEEPSTNPEPATPGSDSPSTDVITNIHVSFDLQYKAPFRGQRWSCNFNEIIPLGYISHPEYRYEIVGNDYIQYDFAGWGVNPTDEDHPTGIILASERTTYLAPCAQDWEDEGLLTSEECWKGHYIEDGQTYYAYWVRATVNPVGTVDDLGEKVRIILHRNNGDPDDRHDIAAQTILAKGSKIFELSIPVKDGSLFAGWYTDVNRQNEFIIPATGKEINSELHLYAKWTEKTPDTRFATFSYYSHRTGGEVYSVVREYLPIGSTITSLPILYDPTRAFVGWYRYGSFSEDKRFYIEDSYTVTDDIGLFAKWLDNPVGDVNQDSTVNNTDLSVLKSYIKNKNKTYSLEELALCDVNRDGVVDRFDVHALNAGIQNSSLMLPATRIIKTNLDLDNNGVVNDADFTQYQSLESLGYKTTLDFDFDGTVESIDEAIFSAIKENDSALKNELG